MKKGRKAPQKAVTNLKTGNIFEELKDVQFNSITFLSLHEFCICLTTMSNYLLWLRGGILWRVTAFPQNTMHQIKKTRALISQKDRGDYHILTDPQTTGTAPQSNSTHVHRPLCPSVWFSASAGSSTSSTESRSLWLQWSPQWLAPESPGLAPCTIPLPLPCSQSEMVVFQE